MTSGIAWQDLLVEFEDFPSFYYWLFLVYVAVAYFAILNVVTGIFVETTLQVANVDREDIITEEMRNKELYMQKVHQMFIDMDKDSSDTLTMDEFKTAVKDKRAIAYFNALELDFTDVATLFVLLDRDQSGSINLDEFLRGCMRLKVRPGQELDIAKIQYELEWLMHNMTYIVNQIQAPHSQHASEDRAEYSIDDGQLQCDDVPRHASRAPSMDMTAVKPIESTAVRVRKEFQFQSEPLSDD
eukprot:CAMPEP_0115388844 /NCGR_PEP_ID=MMETSP0271-20121206/9386_1 /TAXON_ID=71861 /ORGANISM="Scrippsiella trochoidea, Strain CCMP3099" /LENGTH=241 /DNA_ID=CAMNT_0002812349 /DNA_START=166 /DNA_END=892 /DNA_ORIENTATION=+